MNPPCPACDGETALIGWEGAFGFECQVCRARVIRANSIEAFLTRHEEAITYLEHLERVREARAARRELRCPDCRAGSYRMLDTAPVEVDACSGCGGLFLDPAEAAHFLGNLRNLPPPRPLPDTFAAKRRLNDEVIAMMWNLFFY